MDRVADYLRVIEAKEFFVSLRDGEYDPFKLPLPGYCVHLTHLVFVKKCNKELVTSMTKWFLKCLKLLDTFRQQTDEHYSENADEDQRAFLVRVRDIREKVLDTNIPVGLPRKTFLYNLFPGEDDEMIDFLFEMSRANNVSLKFYLHIDKNNFELSTIWLDSDSREKSYGKSNIEDLSLY